MYYDDDDEPIKVLDINELLPIPPLTPENIAYWSRTKKVDANDLAVLLGPEGLTKWFADELEKAPSLYRRDNKRMSVAELRRDYSEMHEFVIDGLLRRGEVMNVVAPPKFSKSMLMGQLAMTIIQGRKWLDKFETSPGRILLVDNELHKPTIFNRLRFIAEACGIPEEKFDYVEDMIDVICLRGELVDIDGLEKEFKHVRAGEYKLCILDAFYKFMPPKTDENDNGQMAIIYNKLDRYAAMLDCAIALVHHTSKGIQSSRSVTDVGAGAGVQSRAADTHLVLRPHENESVCVLDAAVRSFSPVKHFCIKFKFPTWVLEPKLNPDDLKGVNESARASEGAKTAKYNAKLALKKKFFQTLTKPMTWQDCIPAATAAKLPIGKQSMIDLINEGVSLGCLKMVEKNSGPNPAKYQSTGEKAATSDGNEEVPS